VQLTGRSELLPEEVQKEQPDILSSVSERR
jgi:hypothetical protein